MKISAHELIYLATLVDSDRAKPELAEKLRSIYRATQSDVFHNGGHFRVPIMPKVSYMEVIKS